MKLAIIGSRNITNINIADYIKDIPTLIISGGALGVDTLAAEYAINAGIELLEIKPNYKSYKRGAPIRRNEQIVQQCDKVLAFWDGASKGTKYTIDYARKHGKQVTIIMCC